MFPQFGATADSLSKASSLVLRIGTDAHLYDDPDDVSIAPLLDSKFDSEKIEALKRLLALIAQGSDVSNVFPQVVKNVASQTLELKKLVYLYLLHYAEKRPNEALLSINCFQKDLSDPNPLVRAWALRTMAGIRLHAIGPIVLMAISKCAKDPSTYVRKCAAYALPKLYDLRQEENVSTLVELVSLLLSDHSPGVIGAAAVAYNSVCSHNLLLIGRTFRRLCEALPDVDEWGQIILIEILLRYVVARHGLVQESILSFLHCTKANGFADSPQISCNDKGYTTSEANGSKLGALFLRSYIEGTEEYLMHADYSIGKSDGLDPDVFTTCQNNDVKLLLQCTSPLLWSQNSGVILAAAGVHWMMASREDVERIAKPLLFLLRSSYDSKYVVLCNIQVFTKAMPSLFAPYYEDFFVCSSDSYQIRALKLEILSTIVTDLSISYIFQEFQDYVKDLDRRFAADTVAAIGLCAQRIPSVANTCLEGLLVLIREESSSSGSVLDAEAGILVQAIMSIKAVVGQNPSAYDKVIIRLARNLDAIRYSSARALIVWMVGEYCSIGQIIPRVIPVILKYLAGCFPSEELETKHQILNTAVKVMLSCQGGDLQIFKSILYYLLELAKYDMNYDVRDRAHVMEKLLVLPVTSRLEADILCPSSNKELSHNLAVNIFGGKIYSKSYQSSSYRVYLPGSLSQVVLHAAPGYEPLPRPCILDLNSVYGTNAAESRGADSNSTESNYSYTSSGSSAEESNYDLQHTDNAIDSERSDFIGDANDDGDFPHDGIQHVTGTSQLICLDSGDSYSKTKQGAHADYPTLLSTDLANLMSKTALESWLEEQPSVPGPSSSSQTGQQASVRISVKEIAVSVRPNVHRLLEPINGNGLKVEYSFSAEISNVSPLFVCVELSFKNLSAEPLTKITIKDLEESSESVSQTFQSQESQLATTGVLNMIPLEEIASLGPNKEVKKILQVQFHHHLLPLKLVVLCCGKKYPVKLQPDIGYFIKPLPLDLETFKNKEIQLPGMFEYTRRCTFTNHIDTQDVGKDHYSANDDKIIVVCRRLASKVLSSANVFFVSVDMPVSIKVDDASGLCLRFSGETLSTLKPCLMTITAEGKCSEPLVLCIKVNCEETVFGLNLLNRFIAFLSEN